MAQRKHSSVAAMSAQQRVAARHGMTVEEYAKKMAGDRRALTGELTAKFGHNPFKKRPGPGKGN